MGMGDSLWDQDLLFVEDKKAAAPTPPPLPPPVKKKGGCKVLKPKYPGHGTHSEHPPPLKPRGLKVLPSNKPVKQVKTVPKIDGANKGIGWDVMLSESSDDEGGEADDWTEWKPHQTVKIKEREVVDHRVGGLKDHDYCQESFNITQVDPELDLEDHLDNQVQAEGPELDKAEEPKPDPKPEPKETELSEMDKILGEVAMGSANPEVKASPKSDTTISPGKKKKKKKDKKKKKKKLREQQEEEEEQRRASLLPKGPKPKYHTGTSAGAVAASAARPHFSSSEDDGEDSDVNVDGDDVTVDGGGGDVSDVSSSAIGMESSDFDTDFEADDLVRATRIESTVPAPATPSRTASTDDNVTMTSSKRTVRPSVKAIEAAEDSDSDFPATPSLKLKIKLPPKTPATPALQANSPGMGSTGTPIVNKHVSKIKLKTRLSLDGSASATAAATASLNNSFQGFDFGPGLSPKPVSPKKKDTGPKLSDASSDRGKSKRRHSVATPQQNLATAAVGYDVLGSSEADKLYCYCQSPHDDVSEMIGCDAPGCKLEWFHFECVGIMIPPEGEWFCPDCAKKFKLK